MEIAQLNEDTEEIAFMCEEESEVSDDDFFEERKSDQKTVKTTMPAEREISLAPGRFDELKYEVNLPTER